VGISKNSSVSQTMTKSALEFFQQWFFIAFGCFFLFQAIFNLGCGPSGCNVTYKNQKDE
jgi:hypothetical protein